MIKRYFSRTARRVIHATLRQLVADLSEMADGIDQLTDSSVTADELYEDLQDALGRVSELKNTLFLKYGAIGTKFYDAADTDYIPDEDENDENDEGTESDAGLVDWTV